MGIIINPKYDNVIFALDG